MTPHAIDIMVTVIVAVLGSNGLWAIVQSKIYSKDARSKMLLGLGHDRIIYLCDESIPRGWLTHDESENLYEYLYKPYKDMGGNGTTERLMNEVNKLPIRSA